MNRIIRHVLLLLFVCASPALFAQHARDSVVDVPALINEPYYSEHTTFDKEKDFTHSVYYNVPHSIDEEHSYAFRFVFTDFENLKAGDVFNLATDSSRIHLNYGVLSVWNWDYDNKATFTGTITVISKTKNEIILLEDVRIRDKDGRILIYKGQKTYVPRKEN